MSDGRPRIESRDLLWAAGRLARKAIFTIPPVSTHLRVAWLRGRIQARLGVPPHVRENLESALGSGPDVDRVIRRHQAFTAASRVVGLAPRLRGFEDPGRWPIRGRDHLEDALARGRGVMLVTAHLGYGLLIGPILRVHGYDVVQVLVEYVHRAERERRGKWSSEGSRFRRWVYERTRVLAEFAGPGDVVAGLGVRPIFAALARNGMVLIAGDGQRAAEFAWLPILGRPYPLATGFMKIAMIAGCAVLPVFAVEGDQAHPVRVEVHPPLEVDPDASPAENVARYAEVLDRQLRAAPHLWGKWQMPALFERAREWAESDFEDRYERAWVE